MVTCCFYHPKVEGPETCRRCMIPLCAECSRDRYCPECYKMVLYVRQGHTGKKQGDLVVADNVRRASLTRQLMINRLANNVLSEMPPVLPPARKAAPSRKRGQKRRVSAGMPVAASVAAILCAFSLGTLFSRPPAQAVPAAAGRVISSGTSDVVAHLGAPGDAPDEPQVADDMPIANRPTDYRIAGGQFSASGMTRPNAAPARSHAALAAQTAPGALVPSLPSGPARGRVAYGYPAPAPAGRPHQLQALAALAEQDPLGEAAALVPALEDRREITRAQAPAERPPAAAARPTVSMTWPVAGNTLRMTSYVKVNVTSPARVSVLNVTVDGRTVAPLDQVASRNEIAVDTTQLSNGEHRLQVMAMTADGDLISGATVPITVVN